MKKLPLCLATLSTLISLAHAQDNFPYSEKFGLEYKIQKEKGILQLSGDAEINYGSYYVDGTAEIKAFFFNKELAFESDLISKVSMENETFFEVPENHQSLLEGLLDYMNYIKNNDNPEDKTYKLFISNKKIDVLVEFLGKYGSRSEVRVYSPKEEYLIKKWGISEISIYFEEGTPTEAYTTIDRWFIPKTEIKGFLKKQNR